MYEENKQWCVAIYDHNFSRGHATKLSILDILEGPGNPGPQIIHLFSVLTLFVICR